MSGRLPALARGSRWPNQQSQEFKAQRVHEICGAPKTTALFYMQLFLIRRIPLPLLGGEAQAYNISIPNLHSDIETTKALN